MMVTHEIFGDLQIARLARRLAGRETRPGDLHLILKQRAYRRARPGDVAHGAPPGRRPAIRVDVYERRAGIDLGGIVAGRRHLRRNAVLPAGLAEEPLGRFRQRPGRRRRLRALGRLEQLASRRLRRARVQPLRGQSGAGVFSYPEYVDYRARSSVFSGVERLPKRMFWRTVSQGNSV